MQLSVNQEYNLAKADVEYWLELEGLSGQRERFKLGRTDATDLLDDEVLIA